MRIKLIIQGFFQFCQQSSTKVVKQFCEKYNRISDLLDANPQVISLAHQDLCKSLSKDKDNTGRSSGYTSEQILRSIIVQYVEQDSYRDVVWRIDTSEFLRGFVRLGIQPMMDYSFLSRAHSALTEATWKSINELTGQYAVKEELIQGEKLRLDTTVYETNIHFPTDASLLWDSFRTLSRLCKQVREEMRAAGLNYRFHVKKVKKLANFISRNGGSKSKRTQQKVKRAYRTLLERVRWILQVVRTVIQELKGVMFCDLTDLKHYEPIVEKIIHQAEQRIFAGVIVPAEEKIYSLFEEHTELLIRGKAGKAIEFGHKIVVAQNEDKFITHYEVFPKKKEDKELVEDTLTAHQKLFGHGPNLIAGDKGFYASREQVERLRKKIETVSISVKGRRTQEEKELEHSEDFKEGQKFRAGSEGSISVLKRAFKLNRCLFKGYKNFAASVGCAVFCHNLVLLAKM